MQLPVSGIEVQFRVPNGSDDMALLEAGGNAVERALAVLPRLAFVAPNTSEPVDHSDREALWARLSLTDFDVALLALRRFLFGDRLSCVFRCPSKECGKRMETELSISAVLEQIKPRTPSQVAPSREREGWFELEGVADHKLTFRLPTVQDQVSVMGRNKADKYLAQRCLDAARPRAREIGRVERAMELMAPLVSRSMQGVCPDCGGEVTVQLHVPGLVMDELKAAAAGVHDEVDAIAEACHWDEAAILSMPQSRRRAYAETIWRHRGAAV